MTAFDLPMRSIGDLLQELAQLNDDPQAGGITREVFTPTYMAANDFVADLMEQAGLAVRMDAFGNLFGRVEGRNAQLPAVLTGSHIDTTLNAGAYDGVLGVLGGIEALRALRASGWEPERSVEVVCFAGEEPRFGSGCLGSRALTGSLTCGELGTMIDRGGTSIADAMRAVGLDPDRIEEARLDTAAVHALVELHIEQAGVLEAAGVSIGAVTHIAAPHDLVVRILGAAAHAGEPYLDVISGAYHDAMVLGAHVPMGMIFVPSVGGISHSPLEFTTPEDVDRGVQVLAATLRRFAAVS